MRGSKIVCKPCILAGSRTESLNPKNEAPRCPETPRPSVCPDVISERTDDTVNLIKATGFIALGTVIGVLCARLYYSPGENVEALPSAASADPTDNMRSQSATTETSQAIGSTARLPRPAMPPPLEANQAQQQADVRASLLKLDARHRSEPVNQKWANEQEAVILAAISGSANDGLTAKLPTDMDAQCRSSLCKITMTYADEEDAFQMQTKLTLGLRGPIAAARTFFSPRTDGGMDVTIYAGGQSSLR